MKHVRGIILKHHGRRLIVLEEGGQRVDLYVTYHVSYARLSEGVVISYSAQCDGKQKLSISQPALEYFPLILARHDIVFLHTLLELCYYFVPEGSCSRGVFDFFIEIYELSENHIPFNKKLVICKLLTLVGQYPVSYELQSLIQRVSVTPIDKIGQSGIELAEEELYDEWMRWCMTDHPYGRWFKAVPLFMKTGRV